MILAPFHPLVHEPPNTLGRDFLVGDLHGLVFELRQALALVEFDPLRDRLFCVGDLVDRGPYSLECLELLKEPWFLASLGNHERMLLAYMGKQERFIMRFHARRYTRKWLSKLTADERKRLDEVLPLVAALPWVRKVSNKNPNQGHFYVLHADRWFHGRILTDPELDAALSSPEPNMTLRETLTWSRRLAMGAMAAYLRGFQRPHEIGVSTTYVGHTVVPAVLRYRSHVFIDRGAALASHLPSASKFEFCLIEHRAD